MQKNLIKPLKTNTMVFNVINAYGGEGCSKPSGGGSGSNNSGCGCNGYCARNK